MAAADATEAQLRQREAGRSKRWVRKQLRREQVEDRLVLHGVRGRPSNRKLPEVVLERAVRTASARSCSSRAILNGYLRRVR